MGYYCSDCRNISDFEIKRYYDVSRTEWWSVDSEGDDVDFLDSEDDNSHHVDSDDITCSECSAVAEYDDAEVIDFDEDGDPVFAEGGYTPQPSSVNNWKARIDNS